MNDGTTNLLKLSIDGRFGEEKLNAFLNLLGIAYRNERMISKRNIEVFYVCLTVMQLFHWQAYKQSGDSLQGFYVNFFVGFFDIQFYDLGMINQYSIFNIELHKNVDTLNRSKNKRFTVGWERVRMEVYPE